MRRSGSPSTWVIYTPTHFSDRAARSTQPNPGVSKCYFFRSLDIDFWLEISYALQFVSPWRQGNRYKTCKYRFVVALLRALVKGSTKRWTVNRYAQNVSKWPNVKYGGCLSQRTAVCTQHDGALHGNSLDVHSGLEQCFGDIDG